jgi:hypothetical protein
VEVAYHFVCFKLLQYAVELDVLVLCNHDEGDCLIDCLTLCEQHFQAYDCAQFSVISVFGFARTDSRGFTFNVLILEFFSAISYVCLTHVLAWT